MFYYVFLNAKNYFVILQVFKIQMRLSRGIVPNVMLTLTAKWANKKSAGYPEHASCLTYVPNMYQLGS